MHPHSHQREWYISHRAGVLLHQLGSLSPVPVQFIDIFQGHTVLREEAPMQDKDLLVQNISKRHPTKCLPEDLPHRDVVLVLYLCTQHKASAPC